MNTNQGLTACCAVCGKVFHVPPSRSTAKYCSRPCQNEGRKNNGKDFWSKVEIGAKDTCWPWKGHLSPSGYGTFGFEGHTNSNVMRAHRIAYILTHGPILNNLVVRHQCHNRPCCNPNHLMLGTQKDNVEDTVAAGRQSRGEQINTNKLNAAQVLEIRELHRTGEYTLTSLARIYSISLSSTSAIVKRKSWTHI